MSVLISDLVEDLVALLNQGESDWNTEGLTFVEAKAEGDPLLMLLPTLGVYITPVTSDYTFDGAFNRKRLLALNEDYTVKLIVSRVFEDLPTSGTESGANWSEFRKITDTRQFAERYILKYEHPLLKLQSVESQEVEEQEMDRRNFVAQTFFTYRERTCVSGHVSSSSLTP